MANATKYSLGLGSRSGKTITVIPRGTVLPAQRCLTVTTVEDKQSNIGLVITLGERPTSEENFLLSRIRLDDIEDLPKGEVRVKLTFRGFINGLWSVGVRYKDDGPEQQLSIIPSAGLSKIELEKIQAKAMKYIEEHKLAEEAPPATSDIIPLPAI